MLDTKVEDVMEAKEKGGFDAVFMAIGAHVGKHVDIPARDSGRILDAVSYLASVEKGEAPKLGRRVAVYGGGNTAMDAARTAKRLGAEEAMIIYRRDREHMPAHEFEAVEAESEGIKINWLRTIREIDSTTFQVEVMEVDENGRPQPTGEIETLEADALVLASDYEGLPYVLDGSNLDDGADFRPGSKAAVELGVRSPLKQAGLTKAAIRRLSRKPISP